MARARRFPSALEASLRRASEFLEKFVNRIKSVKVGNPLDEGTQLGPKVSKIELGFPYDFITGGRTSWLGDVVEQVDDHRNTVV